MRWLPHQRILPSQISYAGKVRFLITGKLHENKEMVGPGCLVVGSDKEEEGVE